jgi:rubrerythrin
LSETTENLAAAFAGESQANRRYLAFARKADKEGLPQIAKLFRAAAESETIHALNHLGVMGEIKSTPDNLTKAVSGETYEFKSMYPEFLSDAKQDANKQAAWSFDIAGKVEQVHASLFQKAFDALKGGKSHTSRLLCLWKHRGELGARKMPDLWCTKVKIRQNNLIQKP